MAKGAISLFFTSHFSHSTHLSISAPSSFCRSLPLSVTAALEEMSFHGRFAAISKMAALPNGQLPWF